MNKKLLTILVIIVIIVIILFVLFFATLTGFAGNETWSGVINVTGDIIVSPWATLTIEPGTIIYISPFDKSPKFSGEVLPDGFNDLDPTRLSKYEDAHITIHGKIIALGTKEKPIVFTSASQNPKVADWASLDLEEGSKLNYVTVEYLRTVSVNGDDIEITNSIFRHIMWGGISLGNKSPRIINNTVFNCGHEGIDVHGGKPYIENNFIYDCNTGIVVVSDDIEVVSGHFLKGRSNPTVVNNILLNNGQGILIVNSDGRYVNNSVASPVGPSQGWCYEQFCYKNDNFGNAISIEGNSSPIFVDNLFLNRTT
jgi:parallel beta-helix repeat protein